uniref:Cysteine-rich motor neuron 1 protein n=1 Tax=Eptatretus burgeri TaxID=7764 RepID=A0A8C4RAN0_EPTBU
MDGSAGGANFTVMADTCVTAPCNLTTSDCPYGFPLDADGCRKCTCQKRKEFCAQLVSGCSLVCPHGRRFGPHGCEVCRCRKRSKRCRPLVCSKRCLHGFVRNRHGCDKCRCLKCPAMTCSKHCPLGYITSAKGCPLCKCRSTKAPSRTCRGRSGRLIANRETWHDGCRACRCIAGKEMCGLISCPPLTCTEPHLRPGHCCPSCPGDHARRPSTPVLDPTVCLGPWGERHSAGDAWQLEPCTRCVCYGGHTLCEAERCPPLPCPEPVQSPSTCCPLCPANNTDQTASQPSPPPCQTSEGLSLPAGGAWRQDACTSCSCHAGELRCYTARCPSTPCSHPLLRKDQCCPYCPRFDTRRLQADSHQAFNVIEAMMGHNISHEGHKGTEAPPQGSVAEAAAWALTSLTLVAVIVAALLYARRKDPRLAALCRPDKGAREAGMRNTQSREASRGKNENSTTGWQSDTQHATQAACSPITIESA